MPGKRGLPQCTAVTVKRGKQRCKARAIKDGLCEIHHPDLCAAWHDRQRAATRRYWQGYRLAKAMAELGAALD